MNENTNETTFISSENERLPGGIPVVNLCGHRVRVTIPGNNTGPDGENVIPPESRDEIVRRISRGETSGFIEYMHETESFIYSLSFGWMLCHPDFGLLLRIAMWYFNNAQEEDLTEELFVATFGEHRGELYYEKWVHTYQRDFMRMIACFGSNPVDGQLFCDMVLCQMTKYESGRFK